MYRNWLWYIFNKKLYTWKIPSYPITFKTFFITLPFLLSLVTANDNSIKEDEVKDPEHEISAKEKRDRLFSSLVSLPTFVRNGEKVPLEVLESLSSNRHLYAVLVHNYPSLLISSRSISDSGYINDQVCTVIFDLSSFIYKEGINRFGIKIRRSEYLDFARAIEEKISTVCQLLFSCVRVCVLRRNK